MFIQVLINQCSKGIIMSNYQVYNTNFNRSFTNRNSTKNLKWLKTN